MITKPYREIRRQDGTSPQPAEILRGSIDPKVLVPAMPGYEYAMLDLGSRSEVERVGTSMQSAIAKIGLNTAASPAEAFRDRFIAAAYDSTRRSVGHIAIITAADTGVDPRVGYMFRAIKRDQDDPADWCEAPSSLLQPAITTRNFQELQDALIEVLRSSDEFSPVSITLGMASELVDQIVDKNVEYFGSGLFGARARLARAHALGAVVGTLEKNGRKRLGRDLVAGRGATIIIRRTASV